MRKPTPLMLARIGKGLTQAQLGKKLGVRQSTISQWEKNINCMTFGDVQRVCKLLGITDINILKTEVST
jgi:transcriptional regulator with XRE-family HTH domain